MKNNSSTLGYSLVETLVAVSILLLSIVGPMTIAAKGIQTGIYTKDQTTAIFLAQEQVESVIAIRNEFALNTVLGSGPGSAWDWTTSPTFSSCFDTDIGCNIAWRKSGSPLYEVIPCVSGLNDPCLLSFDSSTSERNRYNAKETGTKTIFNRKLTIENLGTGRDEVVVTATVTWNAKLFGQQKEVVLKSNLYNLYDF